MHLALHLQSEENLLTEGTLKYFLTKFIYIFLILYFKYNSILLCVILIPNANLTMVSLTNNEN